jgi:hypothetical protein
MNYPYPPRLVIYAKDVMNITGQSDRSARRVLERIRRHYGKEKTALVTVEEFCRYTGLEEAFVRPFLK